VLILSKDALLRFQNIMLTPADGYVLSRVDGEMTAREVLQVTPFAPEEAEKSLFCLLCTGALEYLPADEAPARPAPPPRPAPRPWPAATPPQATMPSRPASPSAPRPRYPRRRAHAVVSRRGREGRAAASARAAARCSRSSKA
jgi:hypothetical protein